jgi:hypothetical protein
MLAMSRLGKSGKGAATTGRHRRGLGVLTLLSRGDSVYGVNLTGVHSLRYLVAVAPVRW